MRKYLLTLMVLLVAQIGIGQELRCNIQVVSSQIQGTNKQVFTTLQKEIFEFVNNQAWTKHIYTNEERIECNMMLNIESFNGNEFKGSIQIQSRRPVYMTSYNSPILNYKDNDLAFEYVEFEPLEFSPNEHKSDLTSIIAYYVYVIIGMDYETFSPNGGEEYFKMAEKIVQNAQNARYKGWKQYESRKNRYWLIHNLLSGKYRNIRQFMYQYHRLGLDVMSGKVTDGRAQVAQSLELLQKIYRQKPDPFMYLLQIILDAKSDEFVNIFSESFPSEIDQVYNILVEIDPTHTEKYKKIKQQ